MNKKALEDILHEINIITQEQYLNTNLIGPLEGISGIALFHFYYSEHINSEKNIGNNILEKCVQIINEGFERPTFSQGISGFCWVLDFLNKKGYIYNNNDQFLAKIDYYIGNFMLSIIKKGHYDFLHGAMGPAFYFLNRFENTENGNLKKVYKNYLQQFINYLEKTSLPEGENMLKWVCKTGKKSNKSYNLGLSHGVTSILFFLQKLYPHNCFKPFIEKMLVGCKNYILSFKKNDIDCFSLFPNDISFKNEISSKSRLAWCYGDLGIGLTLLNTSITTNDNDLFTKSIDILKHSSARRTPDETLINNPFFCHGAFGNAHMFNKIYKITGEKVFKNSVDFWIKVGFDMISNQNAQSYIWDYKEQWKNEIPLIGGVTGIGLVLLNYLNDDLDSDWDKCLMIS